MSTFCPRHGNPECDDIAKHEIYGHVRLIAIIKTTNNYGDTFWIVENDNYELKIAKQCDFIDVGYYGD